MVHTVAACRRIAREAGSQGGQLDIVGAFPRIASEDEGVERRKFTHHAGDEGAQFVAVPHAPQQLAVFLPHQLPIDAVHVGVVEIVAVEPPGIGEGFTEFIGWNDGEGPVGQGDAGVGKNLRVPHGAALGCGVDDQDLLLFADHDLLPVAGNLEIEDIGKERVGIVALAVHVPALEGTGVGSLNAFVDPAEAVFGGGEAGIVSGGNGELVEACDDAFEIDVEFGVAGSFFAFLGVLLFVVLARLLVRLLAVSRMQLVGGLERRPQALAQCHSIDTHRAVEERIGLAGTPGFLDNGRQGAVRQEIEPLAVLAPRRIPVVVAVRGQRGLDAGFHVVEIEAAEQVCPLLAVGQPAAVRRPLQVEELRLRIVARSGGSDLLRGLGCGIEEPKAVILVLVRDPFAIGGGNRLPPEHGAVCGQLLGWAGAVGGSLPDFHFAGFGGEHDNRLAVRAEAGFADSAGLAAPNFGEAALFDRNDERPSTGGDDDTAAVGCHVCGGGVFEGILDPVLAEVVEVGFDGDGDLPVGAGCDVVEAEVRTQCIDDAPVGKRGGVGVEAGVFGELPKIGAGFGHGPQVHGAVAIRDEVDPVVPPHGVLAGAGPVGCERNCLAAGIVTPEVLGRAALVAFGHAALEFGAGEEEAAGPVVFPCTPAALGRLAEGHLDDIVGSVDCGELPGGQG